jgi:hypothetical protein
VRNIQMRFVLLSGLLMFAAPLHGFAGTISNPTVKGHVVDRCPVINGATDCQRVMAVATAICNEYGFRRAGAYHLRQVSMRGMQLKLGIDDQENVYRHEWGLSGFGPSFDAVECYK